MNKKLFYIILSSAFLLVGCENKSGWYDYGNGVVNLDNVNHISAKIVGVSTFDTGPQENFHKEFVNPLSPSDIEIITSWIAPNSLDGYHFYKWHYEAYIMFDAFKLTLYESKKYLKKPKIYQVTDYFLGELKAKGGTPAMVNALGKLKGKSFNDKKLFSDAVITQAKLERNNFTENVLPKLGLGEKASVFVNGLGDNEKELLLTPEEYELIMKGLNKAHSDYRSLPSFK